MTFQTSREFQIKYLWHGEVKEVNMFSTDFHVVADVVILDFEDIEKREYVRIENLISITNL